MGVGPDADGGTCARGVRSGQTTDAAAARGAPRAGEPPPRARARGGGAGRSLPAAAAVAVATAATRPRTVPRAEAQGARRTNGGPTCPGGTPRRPPSAAAPSAPNPGGRETGRRRWRREPPVRARAPRRPRVGAPSSQPGVALEGPVDTAGPACRPSRTGGAVDVARRRPVHVLVKDTRRRLLVDDRPSPPFSGSDACVERRPPGVRLVRTRPPPSNDRRDAAPSVWRGGVTASVDQVEEVLSMDRRGAAATDGAWLRLLAVDRRGRTTSPLAARSLAGSTAVDRAQLSRRVLDVDERVDARESRDLLRNMGATRCGSAPPCAAALLDGNTRRGWGAGRR
eukprot:TRINITY_DN12006_c0_g1_i1.p1 TRINITY_DN12006_c0_g1~~TRINITY_DN12006_c0_g1_i1.p1  ORF type:complete len:340 (+),score=30.66 TRINITY_DN12006_c0_g1_i1:215-1234(+)